MANSPTRDIYETRKLFGFMFQDGALFGSLSLFDNIAFPLREHTRKKESEIRRIVMERIEVVGLLGAEGKLPGEISGGMRKRAGLARALVLDPQIILCDEPRADPQLPDLYVSELKALIFGFIAGIVAAHRPQPARRPQGCRRRRQPVRRHHVPPALLRQHGDDGRLPPDRPAEGRLRSDGLPARPADRSGDHLLFYVRALLWIPRTLRRYLKEVQRLLAEVAFGSGGPASSAERSA
ncbi:hypothetical protein SALBM217S_08616 [Streptomyces griseoloalbus]